MQVCTEGFDVIDGQAILIQYGVYLCVSEVCCAVRAGLTHYWALGGKVKYTVQTQYTLKVWEDELA